MESKFILNHLILVGCSTLIQSSKSLVQRLQKWVRLIQWYHLQLHHQMPNCSERPLNLIKKSILYRRRESEVFRCSFFTLIYSRTWSQQEPSTYLLLSLIPVLQLHFLPLVFCSFVMIAEACLFHLSMNDTSFSLTIHCLILECQRLFSGADTSNISR